MLQEAYSVEYGCKPPFPAPSLNREFERYPDLGLMVARERFELSSAGPKPAMLVRYTTGLLVHRALEDSCGNSSLT